jgi:hypothetical protein
MFRGRTDLQKQSVTLQSSPKVIRVNEVDGTKATLDSDEKYIQGFRRKT